MCTSQITLINPHYRKMAELMNVPVSAYRFEEDYRIRVPCGHCMECLKKRQQQWFSRADHLVKKMGLSPEQCLFCTFTLKPEVYEDAKSKPYLPIRRFLDRLRKHPRFRYRDPQTKRYKYRKVKFPYLFVVEFADGSRAAHKGLPSTHRMHYHAILFNCPLYWWQVRDLWQEFNGIARVEPLRSFAGIRYVVKYMTKDCKVYQNVYGEDSKKNGKLVVSHGFGRLSKEDIRVMREYMMRNEETWFFHYIGNYRYSIPRYWKNACFTKLEQRCRNDSLIPPLLWKKVQKDFPLGAFTLQEQQLIYHTFLWP